jgi:hypothetical protein
MFEDRERIQFAGSSLLRSMQPIDSTYFGEEKNGYV